MSIPRIERTNDDTHVLLQAFQGLQASIWTALPGRVEAYDPVKATVSVRPTIQARYTDEAGVQSWLTLPLLVDVPVVFPSAGGFSLTFPVSEGDECLVVFSSRCIDAWWDTGTISIQPDMRMHDLSDGFAILGPRSRPRVLPDLSNNSVELRSDDHDTFVRLEPNGTIRAKGAVIDAEGTTSAKVKAPTITLEGNVTITGNLNVQGATGLQNTTVTGSLINNGTSVGSTHVHVGGTISGFTGAPT